MTLAELSVEYRAHAHALDLRICQLEYVLEYLRQQDCEVTAVLLWQADERLLRRYYWFARRKQRAGKTGEEGVV